MAVVKTKTKTEVTSLSPNDVTIVESKVMIINGKEVKSGKIKTTTYTNCESDRNLIQTNVPEPYLSAIFTMWGNSSIENEPANLTV